ncbi:MAG: bifunctional adenosylcobinamide kinase/adenosylcobinamide-phosphate guanylyltransferase [Cyanobium sp.]
MAAVEPHLTLVSGPAGGGKSRWAEHLASSSGRSVVYLATGPLLPQDESWQRRLERHRRRRPADWDCREVQADLARELERLQPQQIALVDSLGTWVAAWLEISPEAWEQTCTDLLAALATTPAPLVLVCEETSWGVVPPTAVGGRFRERLARLQARIGRCCDRSWLVLQGRALDLHALGLPVPPEL